MNRSQGRGQAKDESDERPKGNAEGQGGELAQFEQTNECSEEKNFEHIPAPRGQDPFANGEGAGQAAIPKEREDKVKQTAHQETGCRDNEN